MLEDVGSGGLRQVIRQFPFHPIAIRDSVGKIGRLWIGGSSGSDCWPQV